MRYRDRREAGQRLAERLLDYRDRPDVVVLGLPRGGVVVAYEVARRLHAPLDVFVVRKLGAPGQQELAMGAIASGGVRVLNPAVVEVWGIPSRVIEEVTGQELYELERRERIYRGGRPLMQLEGRTVILVDDGIATGATMRAAVAALRKLNPARIVAAAPTAAPQACELLASEADEVVCDITPDPFYSVSLWYEDFTQHSDEEIRELLERAAREPREGEEPG
ncbi:MAG: phosphoribosyltransferase [Bryobacterales bacterium]|nr:phosphoribosyltransferase [Bryobacteraceae bacterium]MDW8131550.1 phosphoribosyltransferase [Bryobacterales bacterium]